MYCPFHFQSGILWDACQKELLCLRMISSCFTDNWYITHTGKCTICRRIKRYSHKSDTWNHYILRFYLLKECVQITFRLSHQTLDFNIRRKLIFFPSPLQNIRPYWEDMNEKGVKYYTFVYKIILTALPNRKEMCNLCSSYYKLITLAEMLLNVCQKYIKTISNSSLIQIWHITKLFWFLLT